MRKHVEVTLTIFHKWNHKKTSNFRFHPDMRQRDNQMYLGANLQIYAKCFFFLFFFLGMALKNVYKNTGLKPKKKMVRKNRRTKNSRN